MSLTIVTGPARSGTSCLTGLLARCGFSLGRRMHVDCAPSIYNPTGHYELPTMIRHERKLLSLAGGTWKRLPPSRLLQIVGDAYPQLLDPIIETFDGDLCKSPMMCATLPLWEKRWPALGTAIFCLRHPNAVAASMENRYENMDRATALDIWHAYTTRFFADPHRSRTWIFDFDAFRADPLPALQDLLAWLGRPLDADEARDRLGSLYERRHVHHDGDGDPLPDPIRTLYEEVRQRARAHV